MQNLKHILLASHGTEGGRAAERKAFELCGPDTTLHHLIVVPEFWKGMMGDDWLNNAATRDAYGDYVESQLQEEIQAYVKEVRQQAEQRGLKYEFEVTVGDPTAALLARIQRGQLDLVVVGSPRPKGISGFRSRVRLEKLLSGLPVPLLIVPYPTK